MKQNLDGSLRVSPSELKCADECQRKYYYSYLRELKTPKKYKAAFAMGVAMHAALKRHFTKEIAPQGQTLLFQEFDALQKLAGATGWQITEGLDIGETETG